MPIYIYIYVYIMRVCVCVYIYIYTNNGVNTTNGAAAKVMNVDRLGQKGTPWHFWEDKSRFTGVPKKSLCQKTHTNYSDPIRADPICIRGHSPLVDIYTIADIIYIYIYIYVYTHTHTYM